MFKKYFAHEFKNSCVMPLTICGLIIGVCLLVGIGALLELEFLLNLGLISLIVSFYACLIMFYISIHKSITGRLFSKSGYLTLTLPVGTHTILLSKILVNLIYVIFYFLSFVLGIVILLYGFNLESIIPEIFETIKDIGVSGPAEILVIIEIVFSVLLFTSLGFVFFLCLILFINSVKHGGFIKKQNKVLGFILLILFIICIAYVINIDVIPYALCIEMSGDGISDMNPYYHYIIELNKVGTHEYMHYYLLIDFSRLIWLLTGTVGFYFGSYYLIKNKIDII